MHARAGVGVDVAAMANHRPPRRPTRTTGAADGAFQLIWLIQLLITYGTATLFLRQQLGSLELTQEWRQQVPAQYHYYTTLVFGTAFLLDLLAALFYADTSRLELVLLPAWIKGIPFLSSLLMATGQAVVVQSGSGKIVNLQRYICWMHTTPAVLFLIKSVTTISTRHMCWITVLHEVQLGLGAVAKLAGGPTEVVLGVAVHLALVPVLIFLHQGLQELAQYYSKNIARFVYVTTILTYVSFGVVWDLGLFGQLTPPQEEAAFLSAEFLSKILFSTVLMFSNFRVVDLRRLMMMRSIESAAKQKLIEELRKTVAQKDAFMGSISHELRTPLNGIIGLSEAAIYNSDVARPRGRSSSSGSSSREQQPALPPAGTSGPTHHLQQQQQQVVLAPPTRQQFELIRSSGLRLLSLVNDILDATALQHNRLQLARQRLPLQSLIAETADITRPLLPPGVALHTDVATDLAVIGDPGRVVQVLNNLISNAVKFTEHGSITITAYPGTKQQQQQQQQQQGPRWQQWRLWPQILSNGVSSRLANGRGMANGSSCNSDSGRDVTAARQQQQQQEEVVFVSVTDTGYGIPQSRLSTIFLPFEQVHTSISRSHRGLGLGLSIVQKLVTAMGGDVEAISSEGKGSTFTFWLPAYSPAAMALAGGPIPEARRSISAKRYNIVSDTIEGGEGAEQGGAGGSWEYVEHVVERQQQQEDWGEEEASYGDGSGSCEEAGQEAERPGTPDTFAQGTNTTGGSSSSGDRAVMAAVTDPAPTAAAAAAANDDDDDDTPGGAAAASGAISRDADTAAVGGGSSGAGGGGGGGGAGCQADATSSQQRVMTPRQAVMALGSAGRWGTSGAPAWSADVSTDIAAAAAAAAAAGSHDLDRSPSEVEELLDPGSSSGGTAMPPPAAIANFLQKQQQQQVAVGAAPGSATTGDSSGSSRLRFHSEARPGTRQLLVVDDDDVSHEVITLLLEPAGFLLHHVSSGAAALSYMSSSSSGTGVIPDLVLMDMSMPGMDGVEVCRRLRMMLSDTGVHLPIVMVTAQEAAAAAVGSAAAGADDYLTKPYTRDQLLRCVGSNLTKQSRAL